MVNVLMMYSVYKRDNYLIKNKFYKFYDISRPLLFISKLTSLGVLFILHYVLYLLKAMMINVIAFVSLSQFIIILIIVKLFFDLNYQKRYSFALLIFLLGLSILLFIISSLILSLLIFSILILCLSLLICYHVKLENRTWKN